MNKWIGLAITAVAIYFGFYLVKNINEQKEFSNDNNQSTSAINSWHHFVSPKKDFSIQFPSLPHHANDTEENKELGKTDYDVFIASKEDGSLFSVYVISLSEKSIKNSEGFLTDFIKDMLKSNPKNEIKNMTEVSYQQVKGLEFTVENGDTTVYGKAFIKANTVYILSSTAKSNTLNKAEFDFFINSFNLIPANKK